MYITCTPTRILILVSSDTSYSTVFDFACSPLVKSRSQYSYYTVYIDVNAKYITVVTLYRS